MGGSQKSKRITWAPDVNLCQVRLFSSAKPPSEVGMGNKEHLPAKAAPTSSCRLQSGGYEPDDSVPPGFEQMKKSHITLTKWRCPPRFEINSEWQVVCGEESQEIEAQNQRERRVLEAIYPWPSAIPPSPHAPVDAEESIADDQNNIPLIPLTPIEEAAEADAGFIASSTSTSTSMSSNNIGIGISTPVLQQQQPPDIVAAARAALASIPSQSNLIDPDLLVRILSDQKLLQQLLISSSNGASSHTHCVPELKLEPKNSSCSTNIVRTQLNAGFVPPMKDISYYKSLIQQHGGGKSREDPPPLRLNQVVMGTNQEDESRSRVMKRCMFFNSSRGCKNGANCAYRHDTVSSRQRLGCFTELHTAKRVKLTR
ncbi:hypothetical protein C2S53_016672 [Perilla frutescens var. hirtella]|uniref:C3H1-type domain-containing protein n=1 Tax=Perilla frutescens var. hirtella TaxID=608512 RepID=A0AAD4JG60_PERFH|nr:hypothetical protein C2S53_016672 [Perilla frutescens var. hirtella]